MTTRVAPAAAIRNPSFLRRLRLLGLVEAVSTLVLFFVAMPLKYLADLPAAVRVVGMAHGILFLAFVFMLALAVRKVPMPPKLALLGAIAAIVPFGPFLLDRRLAELAR